MSISGPFNIQQGNTVEFVVEFLDINGLLTVPPSATMTVTYTNTLYATQVDTVTLASVGSFFVGKWASTQASLGLATWLATALPSSVSTNGQLRIIQRKSN